MSRLQERLEHAREFISGKTVLITGGSGFIASHLAHRLVEWEADVRLYDIRMPSNGNRRRYLHGDVTDRGKLMEAMRDCDIVFHFAAMLGVERILKRPREVLDVNLKGTVNALDAAVAAGVPRFLLSSSSEIYGEPRSLPIAEDAAAAPVSIYGISKLAAEAYCEAYSKTTGMRIGRLRFFNVYGPSQKAEFVVPRFVGRVQQDLPPVVYGGGNQTRTYTYVSDAINGIVLATAYPDLDNHVFNIGSGETLTVRELAELVIAKSGKSMKPEFRLFGDGIRSMAREIVHRVPDTKQAEEILDFEACVSIDEGIELCQQWFAAEEQRSLHATAASMERGVEEIVPGLRAIGGTGRRRGPLRAGLMDRAVGGRPE